MKTPVLLCSLVLTAVFCTGQTDAPIQTDAPVPSESPASPAEEAPAFAMISPIEAELNAIVQRIAGKVEMADGEITETLLANEFHDFDALAEKYRDANPDDRATIIAVKAMVFLQLFEDFDRGGALLGQIVTDFPQTQAAKESAGLLKKLESLKESEKARASLAPGSAFPDFTVKGIDGGEISLAAFKGRVVLVDFWATWCGPCVREMPNVIAAYEKFHAKGFEIIGISLDVDEVHLRKFIAENKMAWAQFFDGRGWENELAVRFGIHSIPAAFLVDGGGNIVTTDLRGGKLAAKLEELLGGP